MAHEHWRAAAMRWGDPLLELALLLTNDQAAAVAATESVLSRTIPGTPAAELEPRLYRALLPITQQRRQRLARALRRGKLPRSLARIAPLDRFLLGLWLRRGLDSGQLAAASGLTQAEVVTRIAAVIASIAPPVDVEPDAGHLTIESWLVQQLGAPTPHVEHPRPCRTCQAAQAAWSEARSTLQSIMRDALRQQHLPLSSYDAIEDAILSGEAARERPWWRDPRLALAGFVGAIVLALALLILPGTTVDEDATGASLRPAQLVEAAMAGWGQNAGAETLHLRIWAHDPRLHNGQPAVTDVWLDAAGAPRHRVEVRRNGRLVEWQIADGRARFDYAAEPADSSCSWNVGVGGRRRSFLERGPVRYSITPAQQRAALDARLRQGAYGVGYEMLQRALDADDLRSFGTRIEGQTTLVLLRYTDPTTQPARQIVLRLDADSQQLRAAQEVFVVGNQATTTDLWRLESSAAAPDGVPPNDPDGPTPTAVEQLLDPSCPGLNLDAVISPRTLLPATRPWYLPRTAPDGITAIALLATNPPSSGRGTRILADANTASVVLRGPQRWFAFGPGGDTSASSGEPVIAGRWQLFMGAPSADGLWQGLLRLNSGDASAFGPTLVFSGQGWSRDEIVALVESIGPFDGAALQALGAALLDASPLPPQAQHIFNQALAAAIPEPGQTIAITSTTRVRVPPATLDLVDPYHFPTTLRYPSVVVRQQQITFEGRHVGRYSDRQALPDGTLQEERIDDGARFHWYSDLRGIDYTGDATYLRAIVVARPIDAELVGLVFGPPAPLTIQELGDEILIEQELAGPPEGGDIGGPAPPVVPWTDDLPTGTWLRQLWLDAGSFRPLASAMTLRAPDGAETRVLETTIDERRVVADTALPTSAAPERALITVDVSGPFQGFNVDLAPPTRVLDWSGATPLSRLARTQQPPPDPAFLKMSGDWRDLSPVAGTVETTYRAVDGSQFRVVQGPREFLRFVLKFDPALDLSTGRGSWQTSRRVPITLLGADADAWLLADDRESVIIFEAGELLVQISGPAEFLAGPLVELLPELEWQQL